MPLPSELVPYELVVTALQLNRFGGCNLGMTEFLPYAVWWYYELIHNFLTNEFEPYIYYLVGSAHFGVQVLE